MNVNHHDDKTKGIAKAHHYEERIVRHIKKLSKENSYNSRKILEHHREMVINNMSHASQVKYFERLSILSKWLRKDFDKASKEDIMKMVEKYLVKSEYTESTKGSFRSIIKKFYQWLKGLSSHEYPLEVSWLKSGSELSAKHRNPEDMLSEEDIEKIIKVANHPRDKAFIATLAESGCRIGEILTLQIKNINFDDRGAFFLVDGKTGTRRVRVVNATPFLHQWLNNHPEKENFEAPLWVVIGTTKEIAKNFDKKDYKVDWNYNLTYFAARQMLIKAGRKAGIKKPINPHNFRHSRATNLGARGISQSIMNEVMGWKQSSRMPSVYLHISGKQVDDALLPIMYGMKVEEQKDKHPKMFPIRCLTCGEFNPYDSKRCKKCNTIIGVITKEDIEQNNAVIQMSKVLTNLMDTNGNLKREFIESLKREIIQELNVDVKSP